MDKTYTTCDLRKESFCFWLGSHADETVGRAGMLFNSPLAIWISEVTGQCYGVEGRSYGRASRDQRFWQPLPEWASRLNARFERLGYGFLTGSQTLALLTQEGLIVRTDNGFALQLAKA
jgi:hypothetical protein